MAKCTDSSLVTLCITVKIFTKSVEGLSSLLSFKDQHNQSEKNKRVKILEDNGMSASRLGEEGFLPLEFFINCDDRSVIGRESFIT